MEVFEKANFICIFLETLVENNKVMSLVEGLENQLPFTTNNEQKYKELKRFIEKNKLVQNVSNDYNSNNIYVDDLYEVTLLGRELLRDGQLTTFVLAEHYKEENPEVFDEKIWEEYLDEKIEKRADEADFFFDVIVAEQLIKLNKSEIRKYFKEWFKETQSFDLQTKDGDFVMEDGDLKFVPDLSRENIPDFILWFNNRKDSFLNYLHNHNIHVEEKEHKRIITNSGNLIINEQSQITNQIVQSDKNLSDSNWTKANVIIAFVVGIITIIGILWGIFK